MFVVTPPEVNGKILAPTIVGSLSSISHPRIIIKRRSHETVSGFPQVFGIDHAGPGLCDNGGEGREGE